jgi:type II secretory pathway pseudopilin PulG
MPTSRRLPTRSHRGFMFIELLIVLGIIGILGTIVIVAINPTKHLCETANAKRHITVRELGNALNQYQIRARHPVAESMP